MVSLVEHCLEKTLKKLKKPKKLFDTIKKTITKKIRLLEVYFKLKTNILLLIVK